MRNVKFTLALLLLLISSSALAFMPATGLWGVDSEDNGLPGRGFQIEAENGIIVLTYFGYRSDGSSVFYIASGPISNNIFTSPLLDIQGGTSLGGIHKDASISGSPGLVTIIFTSGNRVVSTAGSDFLCEFQITGVLTGAAECGGQQGTGSVLYKFKFSGDKGTGTASVRLPTGEISAPHEMHALRIATENGVKTGINDGTDTSLTIHSQLAPSVTLVDAK